MKLKELLTESDLNYYQVEHDFPVWIQKGFVPTSNHYGSSRIHKQTYEKLDLGLDDEIHVLPGGVFFVINASDGSSKVERGLLTKPDDRNPAEKNYSGTSSGHMDDIKSLLSKNYISKIDHPTKVKYV